MRRRVIIWICGLVAAVALLGKPPVSLADPVQVGDKMRFVDREGSTGSGEFGVRKVPDGNPTNDPSFDRFRTFCVQRTEFIDFNAAGFNVVDITDTAVAGDDPLDSRTAFRYTRYRQGSLPNYDYSPNSAGRIASADALQRAIWYIEEEPNTSWSSLGALGQAFYNLAVDATTLGGLTDEWLEMGIGNVRIMNLTWATTRGGFTAGTTPRTS